MGAVSNILGNKSRFLVADNVSHFGDLNPAYAGSVVKALASSKHGIKDVIASLAAMPHKGCDVEAIARDLEATVENVIELAPHILELIIHAPLAAQNFKPGQFYKLQTFETYHGSKTMEPLALTGASVDKQKGLISLIVLASGVSSDLCYLLTRGEKVVLMGPTGEPTELKGNKVILVGGGLGNAVLFSIGQAYKEKGAEVLYFAAYKTFDSIFKMDEIKKAADQVIFVCEETSESFEDAFHGNIIQALSHHKDILKDYDRMIVIGSDKMMAAVATLRYHTLKPYFKEASLSVGSINSPMQCMMKGICGQCLQTHKDPKTGIEHTVFSCSTQDQNLETVDFNCLNERLTQNSLQEKLNRAWLK